MEMGIGDKEMYKYLFRMVVSMLIFLWLLSAGCGPSQADVEARANKAAEEKHETQTAAAPTITNTPTKTPEPTLKPTETPEPTATITPTPTISPEEYVDLMMQAQRLYDDTDFTGAIEILNKIFELASEEDMFPEIYILRGDMFDKTGERESALQDYLRALELGYSDPSVLNNICWDYALVDQPELGLPYCKDAVEADASPIYLDSRGLTYALLGENQAAIEDFQAVVDYLRIYSGQVTIERASIRQEWLDVLQAGENPFTPDVIAGLRHPNLIDNGMQHIDEGNYEGAIKLFSSAIELAPQDVEAYFWRGYSYYLIGQRIRAVEDINKAIELDPELAEAYLYRGLINYSKGDFDGAIADYDTTLKFDPENEVALCNRGNLFDDNGNPDRAIIDYNKAIEINPFSSLGYHNRGLAYSHKGDSNRAIKDLDKAIELNPEYVMAHNSRCSVYRNLEKSDLAIQDCNKAIELDPNTAFAYFNRGLVYLLGGDFDHALEDFEKTVELYPQYAPTYFLRGLILVEFEEKQNAISDFEKAIKLGLPLAIELQAEGIIEKLQNGETLSIQELIEYLFR